MGQYKDSIINDLLNRVCAMSDCYFSPTRRDITDVWIKQEVKTIEAILDK